MIQWLLGLIALSDYPGSAHDFFAIVLWAIVSPDLLCDVDGENPKGQAEEADVPAYERYPEQNLRAAHIPPTVNQPT